MKHIVKFYKDQGYELCYGEVSSKSILLEYINSEGLLNQKFVEFIDEESAYKFDKEWGN